MDRVLCVRPALWVLAGVVSLSGGCTWEDVSYSLENVAPVAQASSASTAEDTAVSGTLVSSDPEGDALTFAVAEPPGHGTVELGSDGAFTYTPDADFAGQDQFSFRANDGKLDSEPATVSLTVTAVNDAPRITGQLPVATLEDTSLTLTLAQLVVTDPDNEAAELVLSAADGEGYSLSELTLAPVADFHGVLRVPVTVSDGAASARFELQITVTPVNDAPVIVSQHPITLSEDAVRTLTIADLTITDPDDTDFALELQQGANYTADGATLIPAPEFSGVLSVPVTVNDGEVDSLPFTLTVTVTAVDDAPVVRGQQPRSVVEDASFSVALADIEVEDPDTAAAALALQVRDGAHYSHAGNLVTPDANYHGALAVQLVVSDGLSTSDPFSYAVTVEAVNDVPVIEGQQSITVMEDSPRALTPADLLIADPDDSAFTLNVQAGANYTVTGTTVTPASEYSGALSVPVVANDGKADSQPFLLSITVTPVDDPPVVTGQQPRSVDEDTSFTVTLDDLTVEDPDTETANLVLKVEDGAHYSHLGNAVTPAQDYDGALSVQLVVSDGASDSAPFSYAVTVNPVNDPPVISGHEPLTMQEDSSRTLTSADLSITDPDDTTFTLELQAGANYTVDGTTLTPAPEFSGILSVPVVVSDGEADSQPFTVGVLVTAVNDSPVVSGQQPRSSPEDASFEIRLADLTVSDPDSDASSFVLTIEDGDHYSHVGATVTPEANYHGALVVNLVVSDGIAASAPYAYAVTVSPVNDPPQITDQSAISMPEDSAREITLADVSVEDPDDDVFLLTVQAGDEYTVAGNTVTPSPDYSGTLTVPIQVSDGEAAATYSLAVTVTPVNDGPIIQAQAHALSTEEDTALQIGIGDLTVVDPDDDAAGLTVLVQPGANYTVTGDGILPAENYAGSLAVPVRVRDGSLAESDSFELTVTVTPVNDAPLVTAQAALSTEEQTPLLVTLADVTVVDPDSTVFTVTISDGTDYSHDGNTVTPAPGFAGELQVAATVSDGTASTSFLLTITVVPIDDPPTIIAQRPLATDEETALTLTVDDLTIEDPDSSVFSLSVQDGVDYSRNGNTITPATDFVGTLTVPVTVSDGAHSSAVFDLVVAVTNVNDAPVIVGQDPVSTPEDTPFDVTVDDLQISDPDSNLFTVVAGAGSHYTTDGSTITPEQDFSGTLTVPVRVNDGEADSEIFEVTVTVSPVNDPPVITAQAHALAIADGDPLTLVPDDLVITDVDSPSVSFQVVVQDGADYQHSGASLTQVAGFEGTLSVLVVVSDGEDESEPFLLTVEATWDDLPVAGADTYATSGNTELTVGVAEGVLANDSDEEGAVEITVFPTQSTNLGSVTLAADGSFRYLPAAGFVGADTFHYGIEDAGGQVATGTVTINVANRIWYVNNNPITGNPVRDGRSTLPFGTVGEAAARATTAGDVVFVYRGDGTDYAATVTLANGVLLVGEGAGLERAPNPAIPPGARPTLAGTLTLGSGNTVTGLNLSRAGVGMTGANAGVVRVAHVTISGTGSSSALALNLSGVTTASVNDVQVTGLGGAFLRAASTQGSSAQIENVQISGTTGRALQIENFGTVTVPDSGVTLQTTGGEALRLASIGSLSAVFERLTSQGGGVTLTSVSAGTFSVRNAVTITYPSNAGTGMQVSGSGVAVTLSELDVLNGAVGLDLANNTGSVTLSHDGSNLAKDLGGTLSGTQVGVRLVSAPSVALHNLTITSTSQDAVQATGARDFRYVNGRISNAGTQVLQHAFDLSELAGTSSIERTEILSPFYGGIALENTAGTLDLTLDEVSVQSTHNSGNGLQLSALDGSTMRVLVTGCSFRDIAGAGDALLARTGSATTATPSLDLPIANSTFANTVLSGENANRLDADTGSLSFQLTGSTFSHWNGTPVSIAAGANAMTLSGIVDGNTIGMAGSTAGFGNGIDVKLDADGQGGDAVVQVSNNAIFTDGHGVYALARTGLGATPGRLDLIVAGNTVSAIGPFRAGVRVVSTQSSTVCTAVTGNSVTADADEVGYGLESDSATLMLEGLTGDPVVFLQGRNLSGTAVVSGTITPASACRRP